MPFITLGVSFPTLAKLDYFLKYSNTSDYQQLPGVQEIHYWLLMTYSYTTSKGIKFKVRMYSLSSQKY